MVWKWGGAVDTVVKLVISNLRALSITMRGKLKSVESWDAEKPSTISSILSLDIVMHVSYRNYYSDFVVMEPTVCNACNIWCCGRAHPEEYGKEKNIWRYTCPIHGSSEYQMLNDTRGT